MLTMLTVLMQSLRMQSLRNERGVVSVEWIILGAVIMAAIVAAFAPTFQTQLTAAVNAIGAQLINQVNAGGAGS